MRINPRLVDRIARYGFNLQAYFTVTILVVIVAIIFVKGFPHFSLEFIFSYPEDMGRHGGIFPSIVGTILLSLLSIFHILNSCILRFQFQRRFRHVLFGKVS